MCVGLLCLLLLFCFVSKHFYARYYYYYACVSHVCVCVVYCVLLACEMYMVACCCSMCLFVLMCWFWFDVVVLFC